ncbi:GntP family permease [Caproicibacter sp. BJN0012]|uniref:GntP family permease n=1 Tax=Caproicibacter sp. BJN0012 TaxID=3110227 RepID=UPI002E0F7A46|nr:SLC13 family permease [Caproicibacter sp. BJN0012]
MSSAYVLIVFAVVIVMMIVLISRFHVHPGIGILIAAIVLAIGLGYNWSEIEDDINTGFAGTIQSVAIVIFLGCILGTILEKTGAAVRITKWAVNLVGEKNIIWAIGLSSFILGIPIFADDVVILLIPIVSLLAVQTKKSMMSYGTALYMGALITASLVPPTPGPVSAAALLKVPLGQAILWGTIVAIPSTIAAILYCRTLKTPVLPKSEYVNAAKETDEKSLPSLGMSLLPILLPLVLIGIDTVSNIVAKDSRFTNVMDFIGSPLAALFSGCIFSLVLTGKKWKTKEVLNDWVEAACRSAAMPIIVTGMGGALAWFVKESKVADSIAKMVAGSSFPAILVPILIAALIHVITGSNALGVMTAAALVQPMLGAFGISPLAAFLGCGTGALMFKHANSSGFWVTVSMSNMDVKQGLRGVGVASTVAGFTGAVVTCILSFAKVI